MPALVMDPPDPLTLAMAPPKDESPADRWAREQKEAQDRSVSQQIDALLKAERLALKKRPKPIKVLLLGQSESGKSTTVKNFQLAYAYSSFVEERIAWRAVIHLNLVRSVNAILDVLAQGSAWPSDSPPQILHSSTSSPSASSPLLSVPPDDDADGEDDALVPPPDAVLTESQHLLQLRLMPLRQVQRDLERSLGAGATDAPETSTGGAAPWTAPRRPREFSIASRSGWRTALRRVKSGAAPRLSIGSRDEARMEAASAHDERARGTRRPPGSTRGRSPSPGACVAPAADDEQEREGQSAPNVQSAAEAVASCAEDMAALWADADVQAALARRRIQLEESPGFFLNDVKRVAARGYEPSDDDVVRARLRTMGVQEYRFVFEHGSETGREWLIYDVGGARSLRHAWYPYFDDINAIIFLAPISCFDERLAEDRLVNRVEDSLLLWKAVCSSTLLKNVQMILVPSPPPLPACRTGNSRTHARRPQFLNKCDLLHKKLSRGVRVAKYVPSYADRPNDARTAAKYFRQQFRDVLSRNSPEERPFYSFLTSVIDTKATAKTVAAVREGIQRNHLIEADII
ncbi:G-alpha-domain-containing protein [Amylocystis lapponica]|nr:G-alpha-domain-containing protein [Amylocystis lapponica]